MRNFHKSNLITTSSKSDVRVSGGYLFLTGLDPIKIADILSVEHRTSRDEVVQVYTVGTSAPTVVAGTKYSVGIMSPSRNQGFEATLKVYSYTAPATLSGSAATDRSLMYVGLAARINADRSANNMVAVANVGGAGVSMTLTDSTGYYPARPSLRGGPNTVKLVSGFIESTHLVLTTAGVVGFGIGTRMVQDVPVLGPQTGNLDSGELDGQSAAVAGQKYDAIFVTFEKRFAHRAVDGLRGGKSLTYVLFIDNGKGTATTNLTGYTATFREIKRFIFGMYKADPSAIVEFFDGPATYSGSATPAPIGVDASTNNMSTQDNMFTYYVNQTATILAPYVGTNGCPLSLDATDNEGMELSAPVAANCPKEYVVGKTEFSLFARINLDDVSGTDAFYVGFRKKEAYQAVPDNYNDMAALSLIANAGLINMSTILANAATTNTSTAVSWLDGEKHNLEVKVKLDGTCKFFIDGVEYTSLQVTAFAFAAGTTVIPFASFLNTSDVAVPYCEIFASIPAIV